MTRHTLMRAGQAGAGTESGHPMRKILATLILSAAAMAGTIATADTAAATVATSKPCRTDSAYWKGAQPGVDAMARVSKPVPAGYRPALVGSVTRWTPVTGAACDAGLRAIYNARHAG